jgi:hypothetical protein
VVKGMVNQFKHFGHPIQLILTDPGSEFSNTKDNSDKPSLLQQVMSEEFGIPVMHCDVDRPVQHAKVERQIQELRSMTTAQLAESRLHPKVWYRALVNSVVVLNNLTCSDGSIPSQVVTGSHRDIRDFVKFGTPAFVRLQHINSKTPGQALAVPGFVVGQSNVGNHVGNAVLIPPKDRNGQPVIKHTREWKPIPDSMHGRHPDEPFVPPARRDFKKNPTDSMTTDDHEYQEYAHDQLFAPDDYDYSTLIDDPSRSGNSVRDETEGPGRRARGSSRSSRMGTRVAAQWKIDLGRMRSGHHRSW